MKRISISLLALAASSAFAADLPSRKAAPAYEPLPLITWNGFYAGLNAGYGFGGSNSTQVSGLGVNESAAAFNGLNGLAIGAATLNTGAGMGGLGLANTGFANGERSGFIGGGQIGVQGQWGNMVAGLETDLAGSGIRGNGRYAGAGADPYSIGATIGGAPLFAPINIFNQTHSSFGTVQSGIDWMGTLRGRVGYLVTPTLLLYGTGGLAYGEAWSKVAFTSTTSSALGTDPLFGPFAGIPLFSQTLTGAGQNSKVLVGWTAGGGMEWKFDQHWSTKVEALYYDLGTLTTNGVGASPAAINLVGVAGVVAPGVAPFLAAIPGAGALSVTNQSRVRFDGITVKFGINRHFNWL